MSQDSIIAAVDAVVDALSDLDRALEADGMRAIRQELADARASGDRSGFRERALEARSRAYGMGGLFDILIAPREGLSVEEATGLLDAQVSAMVREIDPLRDGGDPSLQ
ncbi:hypothetical protein AB4Z18_13815 [Leifsonia sp. 2TAF2]|uniref:hypothetical protein n=1 Tax=Leifsonia sp. 2TAF2 TaxID=3233009 RepID=UPI003F9E7553